MSVTPIRPGVYLPSPEWEVFEDLLTAALLCMQKARSVAPTTEKAAGSYSIEMRIVDLGEDCPGFLRAQRELEGDG